jgi:hypothetical protein
MTGGILAADPAILYWGRNPSVSHLYVRARGVITRTSRNYSPLFDEQHMARWRSGMGVGGARTDEGQSCSEGANEIPMIEPSSD